MTGIQKQKVDKLINEHNFEFFYQGEYVIRLRKRYPSKQTTKLAAIDSLGRVSYQSEKICP